MRNPWIHMHTLTYRGTQKHTHRYTDTHTHRYTHTHRDTHTGTHTHTEIHRHTQAVTFPRRSVGTAHLWTIAEASNWPAHPHLRPFS